MTNVSPSTPARAGSAAVPAGATVIADSVVATIAGIAAQSVPGVYGIGGGVARAGGAIRDAIGQTDRGQGVKVEVGERQVAVDVTLVAEYPMPLQQIAEGVRTAVYSAIETIVGMEVVEVAVTISNVHVPGDEDDEADAAAA